MRRYIVLLLITGILWAQTDFDTLILKDGTTYLGEYSKTEGKIVFFKPQGAFAFQPIPVKRIERLELKDGQIFFNGGGILIAKKNSIHHKRRIKEKAIYDAKSNNLVKWAFYGPFGFIVFVLNKEEKFTYPKSLTDDDDRLYYKKVYSIRLTGRKIKWIVGSTIGTGAIVGIFALIIFHNGLNGLDFGGGGGNWGMGGYSGP